MSDQVLVGNDVVDLLDIAGFDMSAVAEVRSTRLPKGRYHLRCEEAKLEAIESKKDGQPVKKPGVKFVLDVTNVVQLVDDRDNPPPADPTILVGKKHIETFFITDPAQDLGRIKAFMVDCGYTGAGTLQEMLADFVGTQFDAVIAHRKNKDDPDIVYVNIDRSKIKPL